MLRNALRMKTFLEQGAAMQEIEIGQVWRRNTDHHVVVVVEKDPNGWIKLRDGQVIHFADLIREWTKTSERVPQPNDIWQDPNDNELYIIRAVSKDTPASSVIVQAWSADRGAQGAEVTANLVRWQYLGTEREALEMRKAIEEMENEIKEGDVVRLKCGGPAMVVEEVYANTVTTRFHLQDGTLTKASPRKIILIRLPEIRVDE